jgi:hypothetical protein
MSRATRKSAMALQVLNEQHDMQRGNGMPQVLNEQHDMQHGNGMPQMLNEQHDT